MSYGLFYNSPRNEYFYSNVVSPYLVLHRGIIISRIFETTQFCRILGVMTRGNFIPPLVSDEVLHGVRMAE